MENILLNYELDEHFLYIIKFADNYDVIQRIFTFNY
jgi:hypothetical protein